MSLDLRINLSGELRWGVLGSRVHEESLQYKCVPPWIIVSLLTEAL